MFATVHWLQISKDGVRVINPIPPSDPKWDRLAKNFNLRIDHRKNFL